MPFIPPSLFGLRPTGEPVDESAALLEQLLAALEPIAAPKPPQVRTSERILGSLGDALAAMAAVRAGGAPPAIGPFAASVERGQQRFAEESRAAELANQEMRNRVRIGAFEERLRQKGLQDRSRLQLRMVQTTDSKGNPISVPMLFDPTTGQMTAAQEGFERFVPPAIVPSPSGFVRVPRTGEPATPVLRPGGEAVLPMPPAGVVTSFAAGEATLGGLDDLWTAYQSIRNQTADRGFLRQAAGTLVGETRLGGALAPEYAAYTASRRAALNAYIKSVTGAQFSVKELERYESQYPEPWDPPELARQKINVLRDRVVADMQAKLRAFPAAGGATAPAQAPPGPSTVDELLKQYEEEFRAPSP